MKRFSTLALAVLALLSISCKKEIPAEQEEFTATFMISLPDEIQTKGYSDGTKATELYYAVYRNGSREQGSTVAEEIHVGTPKTVTINRLVKGYQYDIVFWAQAPGAPYTFNQTDATVRVDYNGVANDETRDAFYCLVKNYVHTDNSTTVELRRPFAQINFLSADYSAVGEGVTSKITMSDIPNVLNVLTGRAEGSANIDFTAAPIPSNSETLTANGTSYRYVSMNYILTNTDNSDTRTVLGTFYYDNGAKNVALDVYNVPFKRNYRTNIIINQLFTGTASFTVEIVPTYGPNDDQNLWHPYTIIW